MSRARWAVCTAPCEVIIVLGAAVWPEGQPSPALRRRVAHAVQAFHTGKGRRLLMTGGLGRYPPAEAQVMRQLALAAGVPETCILIEAQATSTFHSALRCAAILRQHGWSTALIVTDRYHLRRALFVFRSCGIEAYGHAPQGRLYSRKRWKRWYYRGREAFALVWYVCLVLGVKIRHLFSAQP
jgi:vancomycin permeability regulator SanA